MPPERRPNFEVSNSTSCYMYFRCTSSVVQATPLGTGASWAKDATPRTVPCAMPTLQATGAMDLVARQLAEQCIVPFNVSSACRKFSAGKGRIPPPLGCQTTYRVGARAVLSGGRTLCAGGQQQWHGSTRSSVALRDTMPLARYRAGAGQLDLSTAPKQLCALSTGAAGARSGQRPYRQEHKRW